MDRMRLDQIEQNGNGQDEIGQDGIRLDWIEWDGVRDYMMSDDTIG